MTLPDKISAATTHSNSRQMSEQRGGSTFSYGTPLPPGPSTSPDLPGSEAIRRSNSAAYGPASQYESPTNTVGDETKLSTEEETKDAAGSFLPASISRTESAARSHAENAQSFGNSTFGARDLVRSQAEQSIPTLGSTLFPPRKEYERADPAFTTPTFWVADPAPDNVLVHAPKPFDRSEEEK